MGLKVVQELFLVDLIVKEAIFDGDQLIRVHLRGDRSGLELSIFLGVGG